MSTGQSAVMLCDWGVKADIVLFAGNTVWSISERVRGVCVWDALYKSTFTLLYFTLLYKIRGQFNERLLLWQPSAIFLYSTVIIFYLFYVVLKNKIWWWWWCCNQPSSLQQRMRYLVTDDRKPRTMLPALSKLIAHAMLSSCQKTAAAAAAAAALRCRCLSVEQAGTAELIRCHLISADNRTASCVRSRSVVCQRPTALRVRVVFLTGFQRFIVTTLFIIIYTNTFSYQRI